jgi:hypothetical protein
MAEKARDDVYTSIVRRSGGRALMFADIVQEMMRNGYTEADVVLALKQLERDGKIVQERGAYSPAKKSEPPATG